MFGANGNDPSLIVVLRNGFRFFLFMSVYEESNLTHWTPTPVRYRNALNRYTRYVELFNHLNCYRLLYISRSSSFAGSHVARKGFAPFLEGYEPSVLTITLTSYLSEPLATHHGFANKHCRIFPTVPKPCPFTI